MPLSGVCASRQAKPLGGPLVVPMPVELPEPIQLQRLRVAVEERPLTAAAAVGYTATAAALD